MLQGQNRIRDIRDIRVLMKSLNTDENGRTRIARINRMAWRNQLLQGQNGIRDIRDIRVLMKSTDCRDETEFGGSQCGGIGKLFHLCNQLIINLARG